ncbi:hypothetical protein cce_3888 [Crocosphaera subtropica ATCC 51142]|uniref:Uncharacterized protein n=1 Tax=Crocosphaera subtropica (strain ATCC 51142 / BH68) TaxID=43989 RepID=B1WP57_CROS5|nr:hypothetical protein [Crocosphaera subtropica]ACB53236.1 hypothetical protein cce_3888 [Crocosphaera subtropica ATCC 51142]
MKINFLTEIIEQIRDAMQRRRIRKGLEKIKLDRSRQKHSSTSETNTSQEKKT